MAPHSGELWNYPLMPTYIDVDCLLPTGVLIVQRCKRESSLEQVKQDLWKEAQSYPLYHMLQSPSSYIFKSVTLDAKIEEFYDETRRLCDLKLFHPMLKLVEPEGNREEMLINSEIGQAIGMLLNEFDDIRQLEVLTFRRRILGVCQKAVNERSSSVTQLSLYKYPPNIESNAEPPEQVKQAIREYGNYMIVTVWVIAVPPVVQGKPKQKYPVKVKPDCHPSDVIYEVIRKKLVPQGLEEEQLARHCDKFKSDFVLRICGLHEYLLGEVPISQYKYIRNCILEERTPQLMLLHRDTFVPLLQDIPFVLPSYHRKGVSALEDTLKQRRENLWEFEGPFRVRIQTATFITVTENGQLFVRAGIYHGMDPICPVQETKYQDAGRPKWDEVLDFDLKLLDIPRAAKLCMGLCFVSRRKRKQQATVTVLCWGNINLFDFLDKLQGEKRKIFMVQATNYDPINPLVKRARSTNEPGIPALDIEFEGFKYPVAYPNREIVDFYCEEVARTTVLPKEPSVQDQKLIAEIAHRDGLAELADQEKLLLWENRYYCREISHSLSKLLCSTNWGDRRCVAEVYSLLKTWPALSPEVAMELLDCTYPDPRVREFAVDCLKSNLDDNKLSLYLLQLVQVLKFEPYIDNPLTRFLLERALLNQNIGHTFFWHLKAEMHTTERRRFGLILEAYCRASGTYIKALGRQVDALDKLTKLTDQLKSEREDDQKKILESQMLKPDYMEALQNFYSPLDCSNLLGILQIKSCKVMVSKKRPLKLIWSNMAPEAQLYMPTLQLIFKNGDDLRQDMLSLQVIRVMDSIWQSEGMDLRMSPYKVLATGNMVGLINVVQNAETLMHIQKNKVTNAMQISSSQLHKWLKEQNDPSRYDRAIDNFTRSCVGYSVATYVLGIGDRHPDNIMVTRDGKLFHIDFGHFLDHRKKKFGVNRERVPFVLTDDLIVTIARGSPSSKSSKEFAKFQEMCGEAYLYLREHASLLCTLFSMMLNSGIPELQSPNDIGYLRKTLCVDASDQVAIQTFQAKFDEAYNGAWTKKVDWFFHWLKNKKS